MSDENLTTTTEVDPAVATFYDRTLLEAATAELIHEMFAQKRPIPSKSGNTIKFRRYSNLTAATTPIPEGVTPPGQKMAKTDLTAKISQFGDYTHVTDVVDMTVEDPELTIAADKLGYQMGLTRDNLMRDMLAACASSTNASGGSNGNTPTEITIADIESVYTTLLGNNAKMMVPMVKAGAGQNTYAVRKAFWGLFDTDLIADLEDVTGFIPTKDYANQGSVLPTEWGNTKNVRWLHTTEGYVSSGTYKCFIIGENAYGVTRLDAGTAENIVKPFGSGGTSDPLNQRATSGWKMMQAQRILNDNFMHVLNVTAS